MLLARHLSLVTCHSNYWSYQVMKLSHARFALLILVLLVSTQGCSLVNRIRAKNEINEAARAYKAGRFAEAQQHSERALQLYPDDKNAPLFIARSIHAQYKQGVE